MRPPLMATPPSLITRREPSIVTTVPPLMIKSTVNFLFCPSADNDPAPNTTSTIKTRFRSLVFITALLSVALLTRSARRQLFEDERKTDAATLTFFDSQVSLLAIEVAKHQQRF